MKIITCTPSKRGGDYDHFKCMHKFEQFALNNNNSVVPLRLIGTTLLDHARSALGTSALKHNGDVVLWADDDVIFNHKDALKLCTASYNMNSIVGAVAVSREKHGKLFVDFKEKINKVPFFKNGKLIEASAIGFCLVATPISVLKKISENQCPLVKGPTGQLHPFFCPYFTDKAYYGEDYAFCKRALNEGFKIFADTSIKIHHKGNYLYSIEDTITSVSDLDEMVVNLL